LEYSLLRTCKVTYNNRKVYSLILHHYPMLSLTLNLVLSPALSLVLSPALSLMWWRISIQSRRHKKQHLVYRG